MENLLMTQDVARILGKSPETVRLYERTGTLRAIRTPNKTRLFRESDVREFAQQLSAKSRDKATGEQAKG